ncbi:histidine kinase [Runella sp.]|uniref:sensor histidine kinase n=1 Tax=Runella sp. TaxID=1960881 RepID=UPI0030190850
MQALKAQINPHFLFNTLNNLYGTALIENSPKTADGIQQLARIMRHAVESSKNDRIEIDREISFLHDYIEIQQLRIPKRDNIRINTSIFWDENPAQIAPLILMTFAENAFKFGISIARECFLEINLKVEKQQLTFICRNSIVPRTSLEQGTGMGVETTLKRLKLLYPKRHTISINQTDAVYEVFLTINLS